MTPIRDQAKTDVVIVGLGAAGGIAAYVLSRYGLDVVGLEAGPRRPASEAAFDEIRNDIRNRMGDPKVNKEVPTYRTSDSETAVPAPMGIMSNGVGGSTHSYGGQCHRYTPWHFRPRTATIERYGPSAIPDGSWVEDWPLSYEDVEPYYDKVEFLLGVSGQSANSTDRLIGGNPFDGHRSREFPLPPLRVSGFNELAADAARRVGWHPYSGPVAIHSESYHGSSKCTYCGFCVFNRCFRDAKASTSLNAIPQAEATGHLTVVPNARAVEVTVGSDGRANGVNYLHRGELRHLTASVVILAGFTYENVRLLLLSKSAAYPSGLSNNHGMVGKGYINIGQVWGTGVVGGRRLNLFGGASGQHIAVADWDADHFDHTGLGFIGGGHMITAAMEAKPIAVARTVPPSLRRGWGSQWKKWLQDNAASTIRMLATVEGFADERNYLDLDPKYTDELGYPRVRVTFSPKSSDELRSDFVNRKLQQWLKEIGTSESWTRKHYGQVSARAIGGARMGTDPDRSVVDGYSLSHEVPNLAILGGATFLNSPGPGPTGTIQALAWRTADYVAANWTSIVE